METLFLLLISFIIIGYVVYYHITERDWDINDKAEKDYLRKLYNQQIARNYKNKRLI